MKRIYAIRDNVANEFSGGLHLHSGDAAAVRFFYDVSADPKTMIAQHPKDFDLCSVADYNEQTGEVVNAGLQTIMTGEALLAAREAQAARS